MVHKMLYNLFKRYSLKAQIFYLVLDNKLENNKIIIKTN